MKTTPEWFRCRSLLLGENHQKRDIPLFLQQVDSIDHPDARLLSSILKGCPATLEDVNNRLLYAFAEDYNQPALYVYFVLTRATKVEAPVIRYALRRTADCPISILYKCDYGVSGYTWSQAAVYDEPEALYQMTQTDMQDTTALITGLKRAALEFGHYGAMYHYSYSVLAYNDPLSFDLWIKCIRACYRVHDIRVLIGSYDDFSALQYHLGRVVNAGVPFGWVFTAKERKCLDFYQSQYVLFRNATFATILCLQRFLVKDVARLIGRLVWNQRTTTM